MTRLIWTGLLLLAVASCITADELLFHEDNGPLPEHSHIQTRRSTSETDPRIDINDLKLMNGLAPTNYRIRIQPFLQRGYFQGQMNISLLCVNATKIITLLTNSSIQIHETRVRTQNPAPQELQYDQISSGVGNPYQFSYGITLTENMVQGATYEMEVSFVGALSTNKSEGFFVNSIVDQETQERRWFAAVNDTLHVFPSLNETIVKATYELSIVRPDNMKAISNMPIENTYTICNETHLSEDHFQRTPPMDMSSVALVLIDNTFGEILNIDSKNEGPLISVHGRRHLESSLGDAANTARQYVEYFHKYFRVAYPLSKLDIVALPQALATPVNLWGVIILQEDVSMNELQFQLTDDIVQQWMTHLATPVSRSNGVYVALKMIIAFVRNEKMPQINNSSTTINSLDYDSISIRSLYYEFGRRYPYTGTLTMKKADRVEKTYFALKMLNFTVTERTFQGGVQKFIQDRQYKVYDEDDLFSKWTEQAREDGTLPGPYSVKTIMWAWLIHDRYPVVTITRNYDDNTARLEQHMLLRDRPYDVPNAEKMLWWIPIQYLTPSNLNVGNLQNVTWFEGEREMTLGNLPDAESFIIVNPDEIGMFMVNYDLRNWNMISEYMQNAGESTMGKKTRVKLLHDAWNLAYAGELDFGTALNMTLFLRSETEYAVWDSFFTTVDHVGRHISGTYAGHKFAAYVCQVVAPLYESLQAIETDTGNIPHARLVSDAKHTLCYEGYRPCVDDIRAAYNQWMHNPHENSHVIGRANFCSTLKWSTSAEWEFALSRALNTTEPHHQSLRHALAGCTMNEKRMERLLNVTFLENSTLFTDEEVRRMLNQMTSSAYGYTALFHFVWKNWDAVKHRCDNNPSLWSSILETAVTNFKTEQGLDLISQLLDTKTNKMGITAQRVLYKGERKAQQRLNGAKIIFLLLKNGLMNIWIPLIIYLALLQHLEGM